jgi:Ca2+-binding EF-hand superfamily protein
MKTRQIALAVAAVFPLVAISACDSQSESERLSSSQPYTEQQPMTEQLPMKLAMLDADQDGTISRSEAANSREIDERFGELDRDKDGRLSPLELEQASALPR